LSIFRKESVHASSLHQGGGRRRKLQEERKKRIISRLLFLFLFVLSLRKESYTFFLVKID
jgi:hypothetical protein